MKNICFVCEEEFDSKDGHHVVRCANKRNLSLDKDEIKIKQLEYSSGVLITKEFLIKKYLEEKLSLPDFKREFGFSLKTTCFLLDFFDIKRRSISESCFVESKIEKTKKTMIERYGVENASQSEEIKEKKKQTFLKNYCVDNIWKSKEYYVWLNEEMNRRYGKGSLANKNGKVNEWWSSKDEDFRKNHMRAAVDGYKKYWENLSDEQKHEAIEKRCSNWAGRFNTSIETKIAKVLDRLSISYTRQFWIKRNSYDFRLTDSKVIIEVQGDYWHASPEKYLPEDKLNLGLDRVLEAKEIWYNDLKKKDLAESVGFALIYFWESEINSVSEEELLNLVLEKIDAISKRKD